MRLWDEEIAASIRTFAEMLTQATLLPLSEKRLSRRQGNVLCKKTNRTL
jgi:hypothetical protein